MAAYLHGPHQLFTHQWPYVVLLLTTLAVLLVPLQTPAAAPEGHKAAVEHSLRRRAAGGFDASTSGRRNSSEVLGQLQLLVSVSAAAHAAPPVAVCWPRPAR